MTQTTNNDFDSRKPQIQVEQIIPEYFRTDITTSVMNSGINKLLTPEDSIYVNGSVGKKNPQFTSDNRIIENSVDRAAWQLQPLLYTKIATVDYVYSHSDILNILEHIGVDVNRFNKWGTTEQFNFAPPVNMDKIINYKDYYWVAPFAPQYITIANPATIIKSQIIEQLRFYNDNLAIGADAAVLDASQAILNTLYAQLSTKNPTGWSDALWDDTNGDWDYNQLWKTLPANLQNPPLGNTAWDAEVSTRVSDWATQNKWVHKTDLSNTSMVTRATMPIIEYNAALELNEWVYTKHNWKYRKDITSPWISVSIEPTVLELTGALNIRGLEYDTLSSNPKNVKVFVVEHNVIDSLPVGLHFLVERTLCNDGVWVVSDTEYNEFQDVTLVYTTSSINYQTVANEFFDSDGASADCAMSPSYIDSTTIPNARLFGFDNVPPSGLMPNACPVDVLIPQPSNTIHIPIQDTHGIISPYVTSLGDSWHGLHTQWKWDGVSDIIPIPNQVVNTHQQAYILHATQQQKTITLPFYYYTSVDNLYVYVNGIRQYGTYIESLAPNELMSNTIEFNKALKAGDTLQVNTGPSCVHDVGREMLWVRTTELNNTTIPQTVEFICLIRYRKHEQVKTELNQYPLFNIYRASGESANIANAIFMFKESDSFPIDTRVNRRIEIINNTTGADYIFSQLLTNPTTGELYSYRDLNLADIPNTDTLQSIWKCGINNNTYSPRYVNKYQLADGDTYTDNTGVIHTTVLPIGDVDGTWEIPNQLYYNSLHECRTDVNFSQLYTHFKTIINNQAKLPGYSFVSQRDNYKLLQHIDYGIGGSIHEYNGLYGNFLSSLYQNIITPTGVIDFAADQYSSCLNVIYNLYISNIDTMLQRTDSKMLIHTAETIALAITQIYQQNDTQTQIFGDGTSYNAELGIGIKNWVATLPILGIIPAQVPNILRDSVLDINKVLHHDGHISTLTLTNNDIDNITTNILLDNNSSKSDVLPNITGLSLGYYFYNTVTNKLWRYSVVVIDNQYPSSSIEVGAYWYNTADHKLYVKVFNTAIGWVVEPDHTKAWLEIDLAQIYTTLILHIENQLYQISTTYNTKAIDINRILLDDADATVYYNTLYTYYSIYIKQNNLDVGNYDYSISNAFTWNYRDIPISTLVDPNILPYITNKWSARWYVIYNNIFNTRYPHLEPWKLQNYINEPVWWSLAYKDTTGARRWLPIMWYNIMNGIVPSNMIQPVGIIPTYQYVCVNTLPIAINGYAPDSLLPPFYSGDTRLENQTIIRGSYNNLQVADIVPYISKPYVFGDQGPTEQIWRDSVAYNYDIVKANFILQPVYVFNLIFGYDFYNVNKLQVEKTTMSVIPHTKTFFHGDIVNNKILRIQGINQWYINAIRYSAYDAHSSDFKPLWTTWSTNLTYQFNSAVNTNTLTVNSDFYPITSYDYTVLLKKSPAVDEYWASSLIVSLYKAGKTSPGSSSLKKPYQTGVDWVYRVDIPVDVGLPFNFFAVNNYQIVDINDITNEITLDKPTPWVDGTQIQITSNINGIKNDYPYFAIMISASVLKLTDSYVDATVKYNNVNVYDVIHFYTSLNDVTPNAGDLWVSAGHLQQYNAKANTWVNFSTTRNLFQLPNGVLGTDLRMYNNHVLLQADIDYVVFDNWIELLIDVTTARLVIRIMLHHTNVYELFTSFTALNSAHTTEVWKHYTVNTNVTTTSTAPLLITGIQNVINFIDGYAEYLKSVGFVTNYITNSVDVDAATGLVVNWQTELEKLIDKMYRGFNNTYNKTSLTSNTIYDYHEVNPFKHNLWVLPKRGIISNIITGPFNDIRTQPIVFNQHGAPIQAVDNLKIYRLDKTTHLSYPNNAISKYHIGGVHLFADTYENIIMFNNYTVDGYLVYDPFIGLNVNKITLEFKKHYEVSGRPNLGGHFLQNNQLVENIELLTQNQRDMYNTYTVDEHANHIEYSRALVGYNTNTSSYLDNMHVSAKSKFVFYRGMIQYKGTNHAINAFTNSKAFEAITVDEFWAYKIADFGDARVKIKPQLIIQDTDLSRDAIKYHFTSTDDLIQPLFTEVTNTDISRWVDLPNIKELQSNNIYFAATINKLHNITFIAYNGITYTDLHTICDSVTVTFKNDVTFKNTSTLGIGANIVTLTSNFILATNSIIVYVDGVKHDAFIELTSSTIQLLNLNTAQTHNVDIIFKDGILLDPTHYTMINAKTIVWHIDPRVLNNVEIFKHIPNNEILSGMKLIDTLTNIAVSDLTLWHPAIGIHDIRVNAVATYTEPTDPATYQFDYNGNVDITLTSWSDREVNQVWVANKDVGYIPYYDTHIFNDIDSRLFYWGKLATWSDLDVYEWTASTILPTSWDDVVKKQQGNTLITEVSKLTGTPYVVNLISYRVSTDTAWDDWVPNINKHLVVQCSRYITQSGPININIATADVNFMESTSLSISAISDVYNVYVNELLLDVKLFSTTIVNDVITNIIVNNVNVCDSVRIILYAYIPAATEISRLNNLPTTLVQYSTYYPYNSVESVDPTGNHISYTFYYWVKDKLNKTKPNNLSISDVKQIYKHPQNIYAILQNPLAAINIIPSRYSQFIMQGVNTIVTEGERYTVMFIQDYTLRDGLHNNTPMLKNIHHEWSLLRAKQTEVLPRYLWDKITETIIGCKITDLNYPIPTLTRVLYDSINFTTTQYGLLPDQALGDKNIILQTIIAGITDVRFDTTPINKETLMEFNTFDTDANIITAMNYIYTNFTSDNINALFFIVLNDALTFTPQLDGIFKTSMISVHSVSKLITAKDVIG